MKFSRRRFLGTGFAAGLAPAIVGRAMAASGGRDLPIPDLWDIDSGSAPLLNAMAARTSILEGRQSVTVGYGQGFLGPVLRMKRGQTARLDLGNKIKEPVSVHWHGLHIEGAQNGGPHSPVHPGQVNEAALDVDQAAATLWYHSRIHQRTAKHVWFGLAGMLIVDDPDVPNSGLPNEYGKDDIALVVQDRNFSPDGQLLYNPQGPTRMMGYRGDTILVNGAIRPRASVPPAMVRLRVLNGSNARIYHFGFEDGREFFQVGSDGGLLPAPVAMKTLSLAPAERAEIVVDFSDGLAARLLSGPDNNMPMMGMMMAGNMPAPKAVTPNGSFEIMTFSVNKTAKARVRTLPETLAGAPVPSQAKPVRRRQFNLNMMPGGRLMMNPMGAGHAMAINDDIMDMAVINHKLRLGEAEIWEVSTAMMGHPFHVHGTSFQVLSLNGEAVDYATMGMKDVVMLNGTAELLVQMNRKADAKQPFMYHCHILEHEDLGMMGQFTVT